MDALQRDGRVQEERGEGMSRIIPPVISFCMGAIITRSIREHDYFILTLAVIVFIANILKVVTG